MFSRVIPHQTLTPRSNCLAPVDGLEATPVVDFAWFDGTAASTADFTGTPTVLNFWASNCAACIAEMPDFEEAFQALGDSVSFVGMNVADIREEGRQARRGDWRQLSACR